MRFLKLFILELLEIYELFRLNVVKRFLPGKTESCFRAYLIKAWIPQRILYLLYTILWLFFFDLTYLSMFYPHILWHLREENTIGNTVESKANSNGLNSNIIRILDYWLQIQIRLLETRKNKVEMMLVAQMFELNDLTIP